MTMFWNLDSLLRLNEKLREDNKKWEVAFGKCMEYQNNGMELEKSGKLEEAAEEYENAIDFGKHSNKLQVNNYFHSIERAAIVYRKLKRFDDEIRIIKIGLAEDIGKTDREKFLKRLEKAKLLKEKK